MMSWNYDLIDCLRYEYPNEPHGPEHPSLPPIPPAGWPLPRVGEVIPVDQNDDRFTPFKARVIGVEWDYAVPRVTVQLEVVREPDLNTIQFAPEKLDDAVPYPLPSARDGWYQIECPWCSWHTTGSESVCEDAWHEHKAEKCHMGKPEGNEPDPLDEDNHGDRLLADGRRLVRSFRGHWHTLQADCRLNCGSAPDLGPRLTLARWDRCYGPLTLAPEPDPLDEADHRDRVDKHGDIVRRKGHERWGWPGYPGSYDGNVGWSLSIINASDGPLTFAPDAAQETSSTTTSADEGAETQESEAEPDPLDENDHRDRLDADGDRLIRRGVHHWHHWDVKCACVGSSPSPLTYFDETCGPLTFAPDDAAEADAVEGGGPAGPSEALLLCPECAHDIDEHRGSGCTWCICHLAPSDLARHLIAQAIS